MIYDVAEHLPTDSGPAMQMFSDPGIVAREGALIRRFGWEIVAISLQISRIARTCGGMLPARQRCP